MIQKRLSVSTATVVNPFVSKKWQPLFVLLVGSINGYDYSAAYIRLTYFILLIFCLNTVSTPPRYYIKEGAFFWCESCFYDLADIIIL